MTFRPRPWDTTVPETFALLRRSGALMISPSLFTSSTEANATSAPLSPGSFSTEMTCPSATRYCLPPVAMTASMPTELLRTDDVTSVYKTIASRGWSTSRPRVLSAAPSQRPEAGATFTHPIVRWGDLRGERPRAPLTQNPELAANHAVRDHPAPRPRR